MTACRKSDRLVVPEKRSNKSRGAPRKAEVVEERGRANGNSGQQNERRAQDRERLNNALDRVRQAAQQDKEMRFTTLWHHVYDIDRLREGFYALKRRGASGVDGVTWQQYGESLEENLVDLSSRLKRGAYRAKPVKRTYVPKPDGRQRPLGIPSLEDKLVQRVTAEVLGSIYETDFLGFSYGFRPGRGQHDALDAVAVGIQRKKVSWVLDADIRGFFDAIDHDHLISFLEYRIADKRVIRHIKKWLHAGVLEEGQLRQMECGTPQGGSISPLLANIYLHYVLDLWTRQWRRTQTDGDVIIVRYADDFVVGFQRRTEGERFHRDLKERLRQFGLELHEGKTRLVEFGRFSSENRKDRGAGKPETFDFLGFTHFCAWTRQGTFTVGRKTSQKKMHAKYRELKEELRKRMHWPAPEVGEWLNRVVAGHNRYYGVPNNWWAMYLFRFRLAGLWWRTLRRRSQKTSMTWERMKPITERWLPRPQIHHPYPWERLCV